jgi:hypothetical protein
MREVINMFVPLPNIGFFFALSEAGVVPVSTDVISDIESYSGFSIKVASTETMPLDSQDGFERPAPTKKSVTPINIGVYRKKDTLAKLTAKVLDKPTSDKGFFCRLTVVYPPSSDATETSPNYSVDGFLSELDLGSGDTGGVQTPKFEFTPNAKPVVFAGTLSAPPAG